MSLLSKILAGLYFLAALGFFYFAARTLKTHEAWRSAANDLEARIAKTKAEEKTLRFGNKDAETFDQRASMDQLDTRIVSFVNDQGRVWANCTHGPIDQTTGAVTVTCDTPHSLTERRIVYLFEKQDVDSPDGRGRYLGEFRVTADPDGPMGDLRLEPVRRMEPEDVARFRENVRDEWMVFERLPLDRAADPGLPDLEAFNAVVPFADMNEEELKRYLPAETVQEYIHDGEPSTDQDPADRVFVKLKFSQDYDITLQKESQLDLANLDQNRAAAEIKSQPRPHTIKAGEEFVLPLPDAQEAINAGAAEEISRVYIRRLRDYRAIEAQHNAVRTLLRDLIAEGNNDVATMKLAIQTADAQHDLRVEETAKLGQEKENLEAEAKLLSDKVAQQKATLARGQAEVKRLLAENARLAEELRKAQEEAVKRAMKTVADAAP